MIVYLNGNSTPQIGVTQDPLGGLGDLLGGLGGTRGTGATLLSYLLFDSHYCRALMALGHADAMARRDEIDAFLAGESPGFVPVFPTA